MQQPTSSRPRVVHVIESMVVGGRERWVFDQAMSRGPDVTSIICLQEMGAFGEELRAHGFRVDVAGWGRKGGIGVVWRLANLLRRHRADVIHSHHFVSHRYAAVSTRAATPWRTPKLVLTLHTQQEFPDGWHRPLNLRLLRHTQVVAVSEEVRQLTDEWLERPENRVRFIANGISAQPYANLPSREAARAELGLSADAFLIGHIGRIDSAKGHVTLAESLSRLHGQLPKAAVVMVGDGHWRAQVEARIRALELTSNVILMGERHDVPKILAALDVFCLPSDTEGMPLAILEAMAAAKPIVATSVGEIPAMLDNGRCGFLVPRGNSAALDRALLEVAHDPDRGAAMGQAARQRVIETYSFEAMAATYEALYLANP